jgi:hypothetical protein
MKYFKVTYNNGYCGCEEEHYIEAENEAEANALALDDIECYSFYDPDFRFVDEDDYEDKVDYLLAVEDYQEDIYFDVEEITKEEFEEND